MTDFKPIIAKTYLQIIKGTIDRINLFQIDTILNNLIRIHVEINNSEFADEKLIITDKFFIYRNLWKGILETLYEKYLPHLQYEFSWEIEISPYTMTLCQLTDHQFESTEIELLKSQIKVSEEEIESDFDKLIETLGLNNIGLSEGLKGKIPQEILPGTNKEQLVLLFRLMNFPPLGELALFQYCYNAHIIHQTQKLSIAFVGIDVNQIPNFGISEPLRCSYYHIYHSTFKKFGLNHFADHPTLSSSKSEFEKIRVLAQENKDKIKDNYICPCCGKKQEIELPEEILQYKLLLENQVLSNKIGLIYLNDFVENYKQNFSEIFNSFLPNINKVDNPDCLILVEGESEECSIPILAFRKRFILSKHNIQVYNSKSKEKLAADFLSFKANYPNRKMICLLDFDAQRERDNIERIVRDNKDKYRLVFIEKGTYEDLFNLDLSVEILNELYPDGESISVFDFDTSKDFLSNIKRIMFTKKKAQFDKVLFAKKISLKMNIDDLPDEIAKIFEIAEDFTASSNFIRQ